MKPTLQLRWLVRRNNVTADEIRNYRETHAISFNEAKRLLIDEREPVLQQWWETEGYEHEEYLTQGGEWRDVPIECAPNVK